MNLVFYPPHSSVAFSLFGYDIRWYGIILSVSLFVGTIISFVIAKKKHDNSFSDIFLDSVFPVVISAIIGARLFYVIGEYNFYKNHLIEIFMINHGGLSIYGAIIFGIAALYLYLKIKKQDFLAYFDIYALVMPLCQSIGRWGNYFNQEAFGKPAYGLFKLYVDDFRRPDAYAGVDFFHPAFFYESVLDLCLFFVLFYLFFKCKNLKNGTIFSIYLIFYAVIRIFVESVRIDSILNLSNIPIAVLISIFSLIFGTVILFYLYKKPPI